jgi:hypothetical protein
VLFALLIIWCAFAFLIFLPFLPFLKRTAWRHDEKLTVAISLSILTLYLYSFAVYLLSVPTWSVYILVAIAVAFSLYRFADILRILRDERVRESIILWMVVNVWLLLFACLIKSYSGGEWYFDWLRHYQKSLVFFLQLPPDVMPDLPSRPPLMNLIPTPFFALAGDDFPVYQQLYSLFNSLVLFPLLLLSRMLSGTNHRLLIPSAAVICCNPMFIQNATYSWTKLLTVFFILAALYFYIRGIQDNNRFCMPMTGMLLGLSLLTHYSAVPYFLAFAGHYTLYLFWKRRNCWRELFWFFGPGLLLFVTWIVWAVDTYGLEVTLTANTSYVDASKLGPWENIAKIGGNVFHTAVPHFLSGADLSPVKQANGLGYLRDFTFLLYQTNLYFSFGSVGFAIIVLLLTRRRDWQRIGSPAGCFVALFVGVGFLVGIVVHGAPDEYGLMHICAQAIVMLGLAYAIAHLDQLSIWVRRIFAIGLLVDCVLGIVLHIFIQSLSLRAGGGLGSGFHDNWNLKTRAAVSFTGDLLQAPWMLWGLIAVFLAALVWVFARSKLSDLANRPAAFSG